MKNAIQQMSRNTKLAIGAVVCVVVVALLVRASLNNKKSVVMEPLPEVFTEQSNTDPVKKPMRRSSTTASVVEASTDSRSYTDLIVAYQGRTTQFGPSCQVRLSDQVYKVGTELLLDNRINIPVTINVAGESYELVSYGYKVITLKNEGKFMVDCNENYNVATITVQK